MNEQESDVSKEKLITAREKEMAFKGEKEEAKFSFELYLIVFATLLILFELFYIKMRGDL